MTKALSTVWKIIKWYAIANMATWAFIGAGRYCSDCLYKRRIFWGDFTPIQEVADELEEACEGYKDLIKEVKGLL